MMTTKIIKKARPALRSLAELSEIAKAKQEEAQPVIPAASDENTASDGNFTNVELEAVHEEVFGGDDNAEFEGDVESANVIEETTDNQIMESAPRAKPPGGYRVNNKFVSRQVWEAYMDAQEAEEANREEGDDSHPEDAHSEDETADMEAAETIIEEGPFEIVDDEEDEHKQLIGELENLVTVCNYSQTVLRRASNMTLPQLREFLYTVRANSGGSVSVAELIADAERQYDEVTLSPNFINKMNLVEAKGRDFIAIAQRWQRVMGGDTLINGIRYQEYHELLKLLTRHSTAMEDALTDVADHLGILVPEKLLLGGEEFPVVSGAKLNTKVAIYILNLIKNNLRAWADDAATATSQKNAAVEEASKQRDLAISRLKEINSKQVEINEARAKHERATRNVLGYAIVNTETQEYLCIADDDKPVAMNNLDFTPYFQEAILMTTRVKANDFESRVSDHMGVSLEVKTIVALEPYGI